MSGQTQAERKTRVRFLGMYAGGTPTVEVTFPDERGTVTIEMNAANQQAYAALIAAACGSGELTNISARTATGPFYLRLEWSEL